MLPNLKNRQKNDRFCRKNLVYKIYTMHLLLNDLWFNIVIWILITMYGATWIWNLIASLPNLSKDDCDILKFNTSNYSFRLISSLIFFFLGISQFRYPVLIYLTALEILIVIIVYLYLFIHKQKEFEARRQKLANIKKRRIKEMKSWLS